MGSRGWATALPGSPSHLYWPAQLPMHAWLPCTLSCQLTSTLGISEIEILSLFAKIDTVAQNQPPPHLSPEIPSLMRNLSCHKMGQPKRPDPAYCGRETLFYAKFHQGQLSIAQATPPQGHLTEPLIPMQPSSLKPGSKAKAKGNLGSHKRPTPPTPITVWQRGDRSGDG